MSKGFIIPGFPFYAHGYFEELIDVSTGKMVGTRRVDKPKYPIGSPGMHQVKFKRGDAISIMKAHKGDVEFIFKQDTTCEVMTQILCGRTIEEITPVQPMTKSKIRNQ